MYRFVSPDTDYRSLITYTKYMSYKIAIASGKGGTGKTTVAVTLFHYLNKNGNIKAHLVDCDVEEPNDKLFFPEAVETNNRKIFKLIPEINKISCTYCRECSTYCEFNAIVVIPPVKYAEVNADLCHSCGACTVACRYDAIIEKREPIGQVNCFVLNDGKALTEGKLRIGSTMQTMLIKELKKQVVTDCDLIIYDAPPGTSCPVVETTGDADFVLLVTEPTPFGLHDLKLMVSLIREMNKPFAVIINKSGLGNNDIYEFLQKEKIEKLGEIPFSQYFAEKYSSGELFTNIPENISDNLKIIAETLQNKIPVHEGNNNLKW